MQSTHTPGPWEAFIGSDLRYRVTPERPRRPAVICEMIRIESDSEYPSDAVLANARLIAAAPAMYEALERIANHEYRTDRRHRGMIDISEIQTLERIARVALAAARGEVQA